MLTLKNAFPLILLGVFALSLTDCRKKAETEVEFIDREIFTTGTEYRVHGLEDLLYFSARQALDACESDCAKLEEEVRIAKNNVAGMQQALLQAIGGIKPPPPPRPCGSGSCKWDLLALYKYFVDLKKYDSLPLVQIQTLNGEVLSSSEQAEVLHSPGEGQFAVVSLPQAAFQDKAVKVVVTVNGSVAEVVVAIQ